MLCIYNVVIHICFVTLHNFALKKYSLLTVIRRDLSFVGFEFFEVWKDRVVVPSGVTKTGPTIKISSVPSHEHEVVSCRTATQSLAAGVELTLGEEKNIRAASQSLPRR